MIVRILPYIEQMAVYNQWRFGCHWMMGVNPAISKQARIGTFRCPSDMVDQVDAQINYAPSLGACLGWTDDPNLSNGMFRGRQETGFEAITDGLTNTIMLGETRVCDNGSDWTKSQQCTTQNVAVPANYPYTFPSAANIEQWGQAAVTAYATWHYDGCCSEWPNSYNRVTITGPPNWKYPDGDANGCYLPVGDAIRAVRSRHPGGVNVALGDASVRFISETIDLTTWQRFGARNDGNPVGSF